MATGEAQIKGSLLVGMVKFLRVQREQATKMLPERLHPYLSERILVSSWYSEADALELFRVFHKLSGETDEVWLQMGRMVAIEHTHNTYQHLIEKRDIARLLQQAHVLFRAMHNTGNMSARQISDGRFELTLEGFPVLCPEWTKLLAGYFDGLVMAAGGTTSRAELLEVDYVRKLAKWILEYSVNK